MNSPLNEYNIYLDFKVTVDKTTRIDNTRIASGTMNNVWCRFDFSGDWDGVLAPNAIFAKGSVCLDVPIILNECQVPPQILFEPGTFSVSVYGGDLQTSEIDGYVAVVPSGYEKLQANRFPPIHGDTYVRTVNGIISTIRISPMTGVFEISQDNGVTWQEFPAFNGWTPMFAFERDGERIVSKIIDWTGGEGYKPPVEIYVGTNGYVADIASAVDIRGAAGQTGEMGLTGLTGERGEQGIQGERGLQGEQGGQGLQGIQGERGEKGDTGIQGTQGIQGEQGETGAKGDKGEQGEQGLQGIRGEQGIQGLRGEQGETGETGAAGQSFVPQGRYDTLTDLEVAIPSPNVGDSFSIGITPPFIIYSWGYDADLGQNTWINNGQIQGPAGEQGIPGIQGYKGWSPVLAIVSDSERRVQQVTDWVGGEGAKPTTGQYVGAAGLVSAIAQAVDIRGGVGAKGEDGEQGEQGEPGADAEVYETTATLGTTWAGAEPPYTQTVSVAGMSAAMNPIVDVVLSDDTPTAITQLEAWSLVNRITTDNGSITAFCFWEKPETAVPIQLKAVI